MTNHYLGRKAANEQIILRYFNKEHNRTTSELPQAACGLHSDFPGTAEEIGRWLVREALVKR